MAPFTLILALSVFTFFPGMGGVNNEQISTAPTKSVEINIAEMSPLGESGGYAVPASACSNPIQICTLYMGGGCEDYTSVCPPAGTCSVAPTTATIGQTVLWTANQPAIPGLPGATFTYNWTGTQGLSGTTATVSKSYTSAGVKTGSVSIYYGANLLGTYACTNSVTVSDDPPEDEQLDLTLEVAKIGTNTWRNAVTITPTEEAKIRWTTTDADTCTVQAPARNLQVTTANGLWREDITVDEPPIDATYGYTVSCTNGDGGGDDITATVTNLRTNETVGTPRHSLAQDIINDVGTGDAFRTGFVSNIGSPYNDTASRSRICSVIGGTGSTVVSHTSGTYSSPSDNLIYRRVGSSWVSGSASGYNSYVRTITCSNDGPGSVSRTVFVNKIDEGDDNDGRIEPCDGNYIVRQGEDFCMEYEVEDPSQCVIKIGENIIQGPPLSASGQFDWSLNSQGRFVLYCDGEEIDDATIKVLPEFQET